MAIAISGDGTITGISVGGIPDGVVDTDVLAANAVTYAKIGTTEQSQLCKAWVNFDGTLVTNPGSATGIRASYNVSSITDNGTGDYTVNFTTAMADANYCAVVSSSSTATAGYPSSYINSPATSSVRIFIGKNVTSNDDCAIVTVAIFR